MSLEPFPRLPIEPFLAAYDGSINALGRPLAKRVHEGRHKGVTYDVADRLAVRVLRVHPSALWGDDWFADT